MPPKRAKVGPAKQKQLPPKEIEAPPKEIEAPPKEIEAPPKEIEAPPKEIEAPPKEIEAPPKKEEKGDQPEIPNDTALDIHPAGVGKLWSLLVHTRPVRFYWLRRSPLEVVLLLGGTILIVMLMVLFLICAYGWIVSIVYSTNNTPIGIDTSTNTQHKRSIQSRVGSQRVLVYGGKEALGSALVQSFKTRGYWVLSVGENERADASISVPKDCSSVVEQEKHVLSEVARTLSDGWKLDAILCVAGGWAGGNAAHEAMVRNADQMVRQSVWPSLIAARLAALHLAPNGLLQFTGAAAAVAGTPEMIGYGLAKAAVHQLTASLAEEKSGLPSGATVLAILPSTLDTPMNRKWMPKADHSSWTPLPWVGDLLHSFISTPSTRPISGTLLKLETKAGESTAVPSKI